MLDDLYIYTAKDHPKRGHRYSQDFRITGIYCSQKVGLIVKVRWGTDGKNGYVRKGEFTTIEQWWREEG